MEWKGINLDEAAAAYLFANTPLFLYKRLRGLEAAHRVAREFDKDELAREFEEIASRKKRGLGDVVALYFILVAILLKGECNKSSAEGLDLSKLDWGKDIEKIHFERHKPSLIQKFITSPLYQYGPRSIGPVSEMRSTIPVIGEDPDNA